MSANDHDPLLERLERYSELEARGEREPIGSLWRTVGQVGALGWLVALPMALGAVLGRWLDTAAGTRITWSLGFLALGLVVGLYLLWRTFQAVSEVNE